MHRFVSRVLLSAGGLMAATAGINAAIDPYAIFDTPGIPGINKLKTEESEPHLAKTYLVERVKPRTLLLGNSSIGIGLDPESPAWPAERRPVFNLAVGFATPFTSLRLLQHALATSTPDLVVIGVHPEAPVPKLPQSGKFEARLRVARNGLPNPDRPWAQVNDVTFALWSLLALRDSALTVAHQHDPGVAAITPLGFNQGGQLDATLKRIGHHQKFAHMEHTLATRALAWSRDPRIDLEPVREMIALSHRHGARVMVLVPPVHAVEWKVLGESGALAVVARWHERLAAVVEDEARKGAQVELWDFSGVSSYTSEPVPAAGDRQTAMRWYWDPPHFKPALGDLVIARLMGGGPADLGVALAGVKTNDSLGMPCGPQAFTAIALQQTAKQAHPCPPSDRP